MAKARKARNQGQNQEQPVDAEIRRAAERSGYDPLRRHLDQHTADLQSLRHYNEPGVGGHLRALLAQGLHLNDDPDDRDGTGYEVVLRTAVLAQLKAIALALTNPSGDTGGSHYSLDLEFGEVEAAQALAGICAMLENAPGLIDRVRAADEANQSSEVAS